MPAEDDEINRVMCTAGFVSSARSTTVGGPVDFKVSYGSGDKSLLESVQTRKQHSPEEKLGEQLPIYEAANRTRTSVKIILCYTAKDQARVTRVLKELTASCRSLPLLHAP